MGARSIASLKEIQWATAGAERVMRQARPLPWVKLADFIATLLEL